MAEEFKNRGWRVVVVGRSHAFSEAPDKSSLEKNMFNEIGVEFHGIAIKRFPKTIVDYFSYIPSFIKNTFAARKLLLDIKSECVLTFGGYISAPVAAASYLLGIPLFIHDQTVHAGRANRLLSFLAQNVFISWEAAKKDFSPFVMSKIQVTGNPVRTELLGETKTPPSAKNMHVYITGGSTGSHAINSVVAEGLEKLLEHFTVVHQCGDSHYNDFELLSKKANTLPLNLQKKYHLTKYVLLQDIPGIFEKSHIIVGRSGANTVIELAIHAKPAVFIPLPSSQYNEQETLARKLETYGSAVVLPQQKLTGGKLLAALLEVKDNYHEFTKNANKLRQSEEITRHANAHRVVADIIERWRDRSGS